MKYSPYSVKACSMTRITLALLVSQLLGCSDGDTGLSQSSNKTISFISSSKVEVTDKDIKVNYVVTPQYSDAGSYSEGLLAVKVSDGDMAKWGYIDKSGQMKIAPQFKRALSFSDGLAKVFFSASGEDGAFIDKTGKIVVKEKFDSTAAFFSEGLVGVRVGDDKTGKWGFINKEGKLIINPKFDSVGSFNEGVAPVLFGSFKDGKVGFIDVQGKLVIDPIYSPYKIFSRFDQGTLWVNNDELSHESVRLISKSGMTLMEAPFSSASAFSDGLAEVSKNTGFDSNGIVSTCGYIDLKGNFSIPLQFNYCRSFDQGLAAVRIGDYKSGKWGVIDVRGNFVINPTYGPGPSPIDYFSEGLAVVNVGGYENGKYGYIDKNGKEVIPPQFDWATGFEEGVAVVRVGDRLTGKYGVISKSK